MDSKNPNGTSSASEADLFTSLCGLASFVTNGSSVLTIEWKLTPAEVSVLASLLVSGVQVSQLNLREELPPGAADKLGPAIRSSVTTGTIRTLTLGRISKSEPMPTPELFLTLAASANPVLEKLNIYHIRATETCLCRMCDSLGKFAALHSLEVYSPTPPMITEIGKLQALESLRISGDAYCFPNTEMLPATLANLPLLIELNICCCDIRTKEMTAIGSLVALGRVRKLVLGANRLTNDDISVMTDVILAASQKKHSRPSELQELNLHDNYIRPDGEQEMAEKLIAQFPHLRALNLSRNNIGVNFHKLHAAQSLEELDITGCGLDDRGIVSVLDMLSLPKLRVLKMGQNYVGELGARAVARFLLVSSGGRTLSELDVQSSSIPETGALELAGVFAKAYALKSFNFTGNDAESHSVAAIINALAAASAMPMDTIDFRRCSVYDEGAKAVGRLISRRGCRNIHLNGSHIGVMGAKAIADSIAASACDIQILDLSENTIRDEGAEHLLDKITHPQNRLVHELNIESCVMGVKGAMAIKRVAEAPGMLQRLNVGGRMGSEEACGILRDVVAWEHASKSPMAAVVIQTALKDIYPVP